MSPMKEKNPSLENNTEKDELSRLPEELIHRIFGLLNTKDAINASFASKSMEALWLSSCPSLHFIIQQDFSSRASDYYQMFHKYVSNTMERVHNHNIDLQSFKFEASDFYDSESLDKWIGVALDGRVCEIRLNLAHGVWYCLPARVLTSSSFLKSLELVCGRCKLSLLRKGGDDVIIINLPCLQSLTLTRVSINEDFLQKLLDGCPLLEHLKIISISTLSQLNISHLKLKSLDVANNACYRGKTIDKVEVDAPCLEQFSYYNTSHLPEDDVILKSTTLKSLKFIFLLLFTRISKELWLSKLIPNFTSLETLDLQLLYYDVNTTKISNPHVKKIAVTHTNVAQIEIDCPMLLSLRLTSRDDRSGLLSSLSAVMINHQPNFAAHLHIRHCCYTDLDTAWFHKLRELLSTSRVATMSLLCLKYKEEVANNGDIESLPISAVKIEQLYIMLRSGLHESCVG